MSYIKTTFNPGTAPGISAAELNKIGTGIEEAAPLADPVFTGTPKAPTAAANTNTTQLATTAFATTADNLKAPIANPVFTGTPKVGAATMVTTANIGTYAPVPAEYDGNKNTITIYCGPGQAFTTIQAAVNSLKKVNAGIREIILTAGATFTENVTVSGFHGGSIHIKGDNANVNLSGSIEVNLSSCEMYIHYITITSSAGMFNIQSPCSSLYLYQLNKTVAGSNGIWIVKANAASLNFSTFSNQTSSGIKAFDAANVVLVNVLGTGNGTGIACSAATVYKDAGSTITGTTPTSKSNGGQIWT